MNMVDIILKKRDGQVLTDGEISFLIQNYVGGIIPDYQVSALLMAIYFNGLTYEEIRCLTGEMKNSGTTLDLSDIEGIKVDKHSSGGVGDKISIISGPIAAAAGVKVAKMSGRGLGFTGGTIDKLESIPGFKTNLSVGKFKQIVREIGISIIGQTEDIAKADKLIYALRDVTGTVDIMGLIASSIMSKKLAMGSDAILLDVKYGQGALMKNYEEAIELGNLMKKIGDDFGKRTEVLLSTMDEPLGNNVGNSCEIVETIETLKGNGPKDLTDLSIKVAANMILLGDKASSIEEGTQLAKDLINNGKALAKFGEFIEAQNGDRNIIDDYSLLPQSKYMKEIKGEDCMYGKGQEFEIKKVDAYTIGKAALVCGAGRSDKSAKIDLGAGITLFKKSKNNVNGKTILAKVYGNDCKKVEEAFELMKSAFQF